jgi:hypothetical protein
MLGVRWSWGQAFFNFSTPSIQHPTSNMGFFGQKNAKCAQKNAILGIVRKFQAAVPPKALGH